MSFQFFNFFWSETSEDRNFFRIQDLWELGDKFQITHQTLKAAIVYRLKAWSAEKIKYHDFQLHNKN